VIRWSYGLALGTGPFEFRSEVAQGQWEDCLLHEYLPDTLTRIVSYRDADVFGVYAKLSWRFRTRARVLLHYNFVNYNFVGNPYSHAVEGRERYSTLSPGVQVFLFKICTIQAQADFGWWKQYVQATNIREALEFCRFTLGWRVEF
jgi:hypothetical protein